MRRKFVCSAQAGDRFGLWAIVAPSAPSEGLKAFHCRCDCGTERVVALTDLARARSTNCGCVRRAKAKQSTLNKGKHGFWRTPEYRSWRAAMARCQNPKNIGYARYGGRGVSVCERWHDFLAFLADMGPRPTLAHSIDRIDVNGNYEPGNCRWATRTEQARNKRTNVVIEIDGVRKCMVDWCLHFGVPQTAAHKRISTLGWEAVRAVSAPARRQRRPCHSVAA